MCDFFDFEAKPQTHDFPGIAPGARGTFNHKLGDFTLINSRYSLQYHRPLNWFSMSGALNVFWLFLHTANRAELFELSALRKLLATCGGTV